MTDTTEAQAVEEVGEQDSQEEVAQVAAETSSKVEAQVAKTYDEAYVTKLRQEAAANRAGKTAAEKERDALKANAMTAEQKAQAELDELRTFRTTMTATEKARVLENAIVRAVSKAETTDPDVLEMLLNAKSAEFEYDEETGKPKKESLDGAIAAILAEKTYLVKSATAQKSAQPASAGGPTNAAKKPPITREAISAMTRAEREARKPEIDAWLTAGGARSQ